MKNILVLLAALSAPEAAPVPNASIPPGSIISINATVCLSKEHMNTLVETETSGGDLSAVFSTLGDCDTFYCMTVGVISEVKRFKMRDERLFAVFEVIGVNGNPQSFWAATQIEQTGWPTMAQTGANDAKCAEQNKNL